MFAVVLGYAIAPLSARADAIIPADRLINWNAHSGVEGGIPHRTTIYTNMLAIDNTGATEVYLAISNAIALCPSNQVIKFPDGDFLINAAGQSHGLQINRSGITLRGNGPRNTRFINKGAAGGFSTWRIQHDSHDYDFNSVTKYNVWNTSLVNGDSNISTTATHGFAVGDFIWIDQRTNTHFIFRQGIPDPCTFCSGANREANQRLYGQMSRVTAISQNTNLTISPPIVGIFNATNSPQIMLVNNVIQGVGIEGISFTNASTTTAAYMWHTIGAANSWFTNCEFVASYRRCIQTVNTYRMSILQNEFHDGIGSDWSDSFGPDRGYGMYLAYGTSFCRIEDNIFYHLHFAISHEGAIAGNVSYANFHTNQIFNNRYTAQPSIGHHGACPIMNLWEHNVVNSMFSLDTYWGNGTGYTIHRNWARNDAEHDGVVVDQYAGNIEIWKWHRFHNIVGNVFGRSPEDDKVYIGNGDSVNEGGVRYNYRFGNPDANSTTYANFDGQVTNTMILSNNWNAVTGGIHALEQNGATLSDSYLYTSKPAYWGLTNWPTIGPDKSPTVHASMWIPAYGRYLGIKTGSPTNWYSPASPPATATLGGGAQGGNKTRPPSSSL